MSNMLLAKQVKKGKCGDSLYAKNLTSLFWTAEDLENWSVTGRKCNSQKDSVGRRSTKSWSIKE